MRATKKQAKKNIAGKIFFISRNELVFFLMFFLSPSKLTVFFWKSATIQSAQEKTHVFFGNARP